jgi:hypothetical protein
MNLVLDTDRFITLLAMSTLLWNWDGYPMARNNYRIYHDPGSDRLVFIPHGQDQMFWQPQGTIYPRLQGLVANSIMAVPEARKLYRERLVRLSGSVLCTETVPSRIDELVTVIAPFRNDAVQQGARLKKLIAARCESVADQLGEAAARQAAF